MPCCDILLLQDTFELKCETGRNVPPKPAKQSKPGPADSQTLPKEDGSELTLTSVASLLEENRLAISVKFCASMVKLENKIDRLQATVGDNSGRHLCQANRDLR
ncbi:hypothetical protein ABVT39_001350 [Epinephelus coioides]